MGCTVCTLYAACQSCDVQVMSARRCTCSEQYTLQWRQNFQDKLCQVKSWQPTHMLKLAKFPSVHNVYLQLMSSLGVLAESDVCIKQGNSQLATVHGAYLSITCSRCQPAARKRLICCPMASCFALGSSFFLKLSLWLRQSLTVQPSSCDICSQLSSFC